jgi:hypothetical protein
MQTEKILLQRRLATVCLFEKKLKERNAILAQAYRDCLRARLAGRWQIQPFSVRRQSGRCRYEQEFG